MVVLSRCHLVGPQDKGATGELWQLCTVQVHAKGVTDVLYASQRAQRQEKVGMVGSWQFRVVDVARKGQTVAFDY